VILSFQFRGYVEPLIVMLTSRLAFIVVTEPHAMGYYLPMSYLLLDDLALAGPKVQAD